jgi:hypothetical protein
MTRASKPNVPTKEVDDEHTHTEVNDTDTAIDDIIDDYLSQTDTTAQALASDITQVAGKQIKTNTIAETTEANGVTIDGCNIKDGKAADTLAIAGKTVDTTDREDDTILVYDGDTDTYLHEGFPITGIADQVWDEIASGHVVVGSTGKILQDIKTEVDTHPTLAEIEAGDLAFVLADTAELQVELADGGRTDLLIDGIKAKTDLIGASVAVAGEYNIQMGTGERASALAVAGVEGKVDTVDTVVDGIATTLASPNNFKADVSALALEATLTAIKGVGWSTETLKAIKDVVDTIPTTTMRGTDNALLASSYETERGTDNAMLASNGALEATLTTIKGATFNGSTDSLEAIRDAITSLGSGLGAATIEKQNYMMDGTDDLSGSYSATTDNLHDISDQIETVDGIVDAIKQKTDIIGASVAPAGEYDTEIAHLDQDISTTEANIRGTDNDTLKTLSDQLDGIGAGLGTATIEKQNQILDGTNDLSGGHSSATDNLHDISDQIDLMVQQVALTGHPANSIGKILYELYINRLTSTRAGYIDLLNSYLDATISSRSSHSAADVRASVCATGDTANSIGKILYDLYNTRLGATRCGYLDQLDFNLQEAITGLNDLAQSDVLSDATPFAGANIAAIKTQTDKINEKVLVTGNMTLLANTDEQIIFEVTPAVSTEYSSIAINLPSVTQIYTIRCYRKNILGDYYEVVNMKVPNTPASIKMMILPNDLTTKYDFKITIQMTVAESGSTTIYYDYHKQEMSA